MSTEVVENHEKRDARRKKQGRHRFSSLAAASVRESFSLLSGSLVPMSGAMYSPTSSPHSHTYQADSPSEWNLGDDQLEEEEALISASVTDEQLATLAGTTELASVTFLQLAVDSTHVPLGTIGEHVPMSGNFTVREDFDGEALPFHWMTLRVPQSDWWALDGGALVLDARPVELGSGTQPSYLGRRQQHQNAVATTKVAFSPESPGDEAGLAVLQSDEYFYALGLTVSDAGEPQIALRQRAEPDAVAQDRERSPLAAV